MEGEGRMKRVAIACQGGGSHTAFTAGVLKKLLTQRQERYEMVGFSGASGGVGSPRKEQLPEHQRRRPVDEKVVPLYGSPDETGEGHPAHRQDEALGNLESRHVP